MVSECKWNSIVLFPLTFFFNFKLLPDRLIYRSIDLDGRKTRAATSTRYKNKTKTSSKNIEVFIASCP